MHSLLDVMAAKQPYTVISRSVPIHPTVSELLPTLQSALVDMAQLTVAEIILAVDEPIDATQCAGKENCMGEDAGRCMTHDLWASLNTKMIEHLNSISLKKLVGDQLAKGVSVEEHPVKRAISTQPVVKPIRITAPNSVFALGNAFSK